MARGRLKPELIERTEAFSDRCIAVAEELGAHCRFHRVLEQLAASGSSVGANIAVADEAMSVRDFRKSLAVVSKELAETRFWLRLTIRRRWLPASRLEPLLAELGGVEACRWFDPHQNRATERCSKLISNLILKVQHLAI